MKDASKFSLSTQKGIQQIKIWIMAARPKTLTAGMIPVLVGTALASQLMGHLNWAVAFQTLICSVLIQIGINLTNDALDFQRGADNHRRIGFKRVTYLGLIAPKYVLMGGFICFSLALLCGIPLIFHAGWPLLAVILVSIVLGYLYTGGPFPLAYYGLGDLFAFLFFGLVCTASAFYAQTGFVDSAAMLAGTQIGCLAMAMIAINNLRDIEGDERARKHTLAVIFGKTFARIEISIVSLTPFFLGFYWAQMGKFWAAWLPLLLLPLIFSNLKSIWKEDPSVRYNQYFIRGAQIHLFFGLTVIAGLSI